MIGYKWYNILNLSREILILFKFYMIILCESKKEGWNKKMYIGSLE